LQYYCTQVGPALQCRCIGLGPRLQCHCIGLESAGPRPRCRIPIGRASPMARPARWL